MGLPRHLRERFNESDGSAKESGSATAGQLATSAAAPGPQGAVPAMADASTASGQEGAASAALSASLAASDTGQPGADAVASVQALRVAPELAGDEGGSASSTAGNGNTSTSTSISEGPDANFRRMEGRYKAQIERLNGQMAELREQARGASVLTDLLAERSAELARLQAGAQGGVSDASGASAAPPDEGLVLTEQERELYGDLEPVLGRFVQATRTPLLREIEALKQRASEADSRIGHGDERMFVRDVRAQVAGFDALTHSAQWQEFLVRKVPFTQLLVGDALRAAHEARDLERVVSIFDAFVSEQPRAAAAAGMGPATAPAVSAGAAQPAAQGLAQFATPDRTAANPPGKPSPRFRNADYGARAADMRAGRMSKQAFMQFENDFLEARRAGLVS